MSRTLRCKTTMLLVAVGLVASLLPSLEGQVSGCPAASGPDAEVGWTAYRNAELAEARRRFDRALELCPDDQYARTGRAYVSLREGETAEARGLFERVVQAAPDDVDALVGLGIVAWREGDLEAVRSHFSRVAEIEPGHATAVEYLDRLGEAATPARRDSADVAWDEGELDRAFDLYSDRLQGDSTDGLALLRMGQMLSWREEFGPALDALNRLVTLEPENADARLARARVHAWSGDLRRAIADVEGLLSIAPDDPDALAALALFQSWAGKLDESLATYDALLSIAPGHEAGRLRQAQTRAWASRVEESLTSYEAILETDPDDREARLGLATALGWAEQFDRSIEEFDRVLEQAPGELRALTGKATTYLGADRLMDAEGAARAAVEVDGTSGAAWGSLGRVYRAQRRDAAARDALRRAARLAPLDADIRDQLRSVELARSPDFRPTVTGEDDSDGNRMVTTSVDGSVQLSSPVRMRVRGYARSLEQSAPTFRRGQRAYGLTVGGEVQAGPGWLLSADLGGSATDSEGTSSFLAVAARVRSPERRRLGVSIGVSSRGLDETASLVRTGVQAREAVMTLRWLPDPSWRVDGSVSQGEYEGAEANGRRAWSIGASRRLGRLFSLGLVHRGFSFEKNLDEGYFDPDFYGIAELTGYWLYRPAPWSFLIEVAPGVEQVTKDGDPRASFRSNLRLGYLVGRAREVSMSFGYSSAGLTTFASGADDYRYLAVVLGVSWTF
jgi:tetratricopeptide (TPR) repeat protein